MAQITVTGTITDVAGTDLTNTSSAFVRFRLRGYQGFAPRVAGTAIICETQIDALPNGSGAISQALYKNSDINPSSTYWTVEFWNLGRITSSGNWIFNVNTDLDTAAQLNAPPVPAGFSLILENNGALNSSQSTLNLESTDASVTITDVGGGTLNLQAGKGSSFSISGQGWFAGPGVISWTAITSGSGSGGNSHIIDITGSVTANTVVAHQFALQSSWALAKIAYQLSGTTAGGKIYFGIYDASGNKLTEAALDGSIGTLQIVNLSPAVTLPAGVYYFCASSTSNAITGPAMGAPTAPAQTMAALNATTVKWGYAANAVSAGIMPTTLGALTAVTNLNADTVPIPIWLV